MPVPKGNKEEVLQLKVSDFYGINVLEDKDGNIYRINNDGYFCVNKSSLGVEIKSGP